jgi:predicted PurR-regulated permease PerM
MTSKELSNGILRAIGIVVTILTALWFLYKIESVLVYLIIAAIIALLGDPIVRFFNKKLKFPKMLAVISVMGLFVGFLLLIFSMFIPIITEQGQNLALLDIDKFESNFQVVTEEANRYLLSHNIHLMENIKIGALFSNLNLSAIPDFLNKFVGVLGNFSIGLFAVLFISFFFLKDNQLLHNAVFAVVPDKDEARFAKTAKQIKTLLTKYFAGLVLQISILFVIYSIILLVFGVQNAIIIAFLAAMLNLIPYVGPLISMVLMALLTMTSYIGQDFQAVILPKTIYVTLGFLFAQMIDNFVSQPIIYSKVAKSHPLEIFLIILISGSLFGIIGLIIAIPAYTSLKVILLEFFSRYKIVQKLTKNY